MGDMARQDRADSGPVSTEGDEVKRRRERIGMSKVELAELAGVSRDTLAAIEAGEGFRRDTLTKIQSALTAQEVEHGITEPVAPTSQGPRVIVVRLKNDLGEVVVEGTGEDAVALEAMALRLLRGLGQ